MSTEKNWLIWYLSVTSLFSHTKWSKHPEKPRFHTVFTLSLAKNCSLAKVFPSTLELWKEVWLASSACVRFHWVLGDNWDWQPGQCGRHWLLGLLSSNFLIFIHIIKINLSTFSQYSCIYSESIYTYLCINILYILYNTHKCTFKKCYTK